MSNSPSTDGHLSVCDLWNTIFAPFYVTTPYVLHCFMLQSFRGSFFHAALFSCCSFSMLEFMFVMLLLITLHPSMLQRYRVAFFSRCILHILHIFLELHLFLAATFPCCTFLMLEHYHVEPLHVRFHSRFSFFRLHFFMLHF